MSYKLGYYDDVAHTPIELTTDANSVVLTTAAGLPYFIGRFFFSLLDAAATSTGDLSGVGDTTTALFTSFSKGSLSGVGDTATTGFMSYSLGMLV